MAVDVQFEGSRRAQRLHRSRAALRMRADELDQHAGITACDPMYEAHMWRSRKKVAYIPLGVRPTPVQSVEVQLSGAS